MIERRRLLGLGSAAAAAPLGRARGAGASLLQIRRHVTLGRTGLEVSDISFGVASSSDAVDERDQALTPEDYAKLGRGAGAGLACAHRACLDACWFGLPIPTFTRAAATRLG